MTLDLPGPQTRGTIEVIARDVPLVGVTAEPGPGADEIKSIEILLGASPDRQVMHTIHQPTRVFVGQVCNGHDEVILIESLGDPTVRLDFSEPARSGEIHATFGAETVLP